ncbi:MAG: hypothetical protein ACFFAN_14470 [Promethearchaeota archaeon]
MEIFFSRSEKVFKEMIGEIKTRNYFDEIKKAINNIPNEFRGDMGSEISKELFNLSRDLYDKTPEFIERILDHILIFTKSLSFIKDRNRMQVNQTIINQSKNKMRSLLDLMKEFIEKAKIGDILRDSENFKDILNHVTGQKSQFTQFKDIELFLKRAETKIYYKIGEEKSFTLFKKIDDSLKKIEGQHQIYMRSEIAKYLFKFSQDVDEISPEILINILNHVIVFINSISNLKGKSISQINQEIINRSKKQMRGLFDLFKSFLDKVKKGALMEISGDIKDILFYTLGGEEERIQFTDVGGFLKRVENKYAKKIGEAKAKTYIDQIIKHIHLIPNIHKDYFGYDIAKLLFKFSEKLNNLDSNYIELLLKSAILFLHSVKELSDLNQEQLNQFIINRSNRKSRNLIDLFKAFLEKNKEHMFKGKTPNFDDILLHTYGFNIEPKIIEEAPHIHDLMEDYYNDFPIAREHAKWATAIFKAIPRYLEILPNDDGDKVLDDLWNMTFPEDQIMPKFREKIIQLSRDDEKSFLASLLNMLSQQILINENLDCALTGSIAFIILAKVFIEIFSGRNALVRAIKIRDHLKERKNTSRERKEDIDYNIQKIVEEDFKSIKRRSYTLKTIITIVSAKGFYIKITDIVKEDYPKEIIKIYSAQDPLRHIGKNYLDSSMFGEIVISLKFFLKKLNFAKKFYDEFIYDFLSIPPDAFSKIEFLKNFFEILLELEDNLEPNRYYSYNLEVSEHSVYFSILKYLYEHLSEIFNIILSIFKQKEKGLKIITIPQYLSKEKLEENNNQIQEIEMEIKDHLTNGFSNDSEKLIWLKNSLELRKTDIMKFQLMDNLLNKAKKNKDILNTRIKFSDTLFNFLHKLKKVHLNLPAPFTQYFDNLEDFYKEIDIFVEKIRDISNLGYIFPSEFRKRYETAIIVKKQLTKLISNNLFTDQISILSDISRKNISFD